MPRLDLSHEQHTDQMPKTEQMPPINDPSDYDGDIVQVERTHQQDYLDELAFMQEPVTIRIEPSADRNAARTYPVWVNGKRAEVLWNGRWMEVGYLPVGEMLTVRRSTVEVILRAKVTSIQTEFNATDERPVNRIVPTTTPVHSFSIIEDPNPKGPAWASELRRRNL